MTLDIARQAHPDFGFAVYAYQPRGDVTIEVHTPDGSIFTATGPSEAVAIAELFPSLQLEDTRDERTLPEPDIFG